MVLVVETRLILDVFNYDVEAISTTLAADIPRLENNQKVIFYTPALWQTTKVGHSSSMGTVELQRHSYGQLH